MYSSVKIERKDYYRKLYALLILVVLGFIWGSGYTLARYVTINGVSPLGYAFWQSLGPAVLLSALVLIFKPNAFLQAPHYLKFYLICGFIGIAVPNTNMYFTAAHLPAGILAVIVNTVPIMTYVFALVFGLESFRFIRCLSVILGFTGLILLVQFQAHSAPQAWHWVLLALLTPICFALCAIYVSARDPVKAQYFYMDAAGMMIASSVLLSPLVLATHEFYWPSEHLTRVDAAILLEIILSSIGYFLLFHLIKLAGAVYYSFVGCVVALTGLFWGWLVFSESLSSKAVLAVAFILLGLLLITLKTTKWRKPCGSCNN